MPASHRRHVRPRARVRAVQVWLSACPKPLAARPRGGWLQLQMHYDLAQFNRQIERIQVTPLRRSHADGPAPPFGRLPRPAIPRS